MNQLSEQKHNEVASYSAQYSADFVERWDELIDWEKRKAGEGGFFEKLLREHGVRSVIDVSTAAASMRYSSSKRGLRWSPPTAAARC